MNIDELTLGQIKQIRELTDGSATSATSAASHPWQIGAHYVIRTVTMIQTGTLIAVHSQELVLADACWIADTGRWHDFLKNPDSVKEVEPFTENAIIGRGGVIDAQVLPKFKRSQK